MLSKKVNFQYFKHPKDKVEEKRALLKRNLELLVHDKFYYDLNTLTKPQNTKDIV